MKIVYEENIQFCIFKAENFFVMNLKCKNLNVWQLLFLSQSLHNMSILKYDTIDMWNDCWSKLDLIKINVVWYEKYKFVDHFVFS